MLRFMRLAALSFLAAALTAPVRADNTPAPPDWQDGRGASVYLGMNHKPESSEGPAEESRYAPAREPASLVAPPAAVAVPAKVDVAVKPAVHEEPETSDDSAGRRLAPPSGRDDKATVGPRKLIDLGVPVHSIYTVITALAIVIGAFLMFAWALRRSGKGVASRRRFLPTDAVSVLGRVPLAARQFAELLRVGNKLVLVAVTPNGPTTLTEVTDPTEVDRLVGLCQQFDSASTTKAFEQVFQQFSNEPTGAGFLGGDSLPTSLPSAASAYRSQRGTTRV